MGKVKSSRPSDATVAATVFGLIQFAPAIMTVMWAFNSLTENHVVVFVVALIFLAFVAFASVKIFQMQRIPPTFLGVVFTFVTFTAFIDTFISLSLAFPWFELGRFYLEHGERYFRCMYGFMCLFWDGTFHVVIQFALAFLVMTKREYHFTALVWAGSVLNSMAPLLLGAGTGPYSSEIQLSTALNGPYVFLPMGIIFYRFKQVKRPENTHGSHLSQSSVSAIVDLILLAYNFIVPILHLIRVLCVLDSQTPVALFWKTQIEPILDSSTIADVNDKQDYAFVKVQVLQWAWWFAIWHWLCLYEAFERIRTNKRTFLLGVYGVDIAAVVLGGYLQSIVLYIVTQAWDMKDGEYGFFPRSHVSVPPQFWIVNLATLVASALHFINFHAQDVEGVEEKQD